MKDARFTAPTLFVLWDINHTLVEDNGVAKEIYAHAFELLTGRRADHPAPMHVRSEPEMMLNMLLLHGIKPSPEYASRMTEALEAATAAKANILRERGHECPGARDALARLQEQPEIIQSALSGDTKPNAIIRLSVFNLDGYIDFEVGGYGSDNHVPENLVRIAAERASMKYHAVFDSANTVLVGSTLRDIRTGRKVGARVVGVATGPDSADALRLKVPTSSFLIFRIRAP